MKNVEPLDLNDPDYDDPIVAEIHRIREEISASFNHDTAEIGRYLQEQGRLHPDQMSSRRPRLTPMPISRAARENS